MASTRRLAISNIAWDAHDDAEVAALLAREGMNGVEIAPTKWRPDPLNATAAETARYRGMWEDRGLPIVALQALLFGRPDLQLFGDSRPRLAEYLERVIELGAALGAHALVFGSPKNRLRGAMPLAHATTIAVDFFREIGDYAAEHGVVLAIEANPPEYGCDFITTTAEAIALAESIANPGIGVNGDLGGITMSGDDVAASIARAGALLAHFHASEPELAELGTAGADHAAAARALGAAGYEGWVSVEMKAVGVEGVRRAVRRARGRYGE